MTEAVIAAVYPDTVACRLGLVPGDRVLRVNGKVPADLIAFQWAWAGEEVRLETLTGDSIRLDTVQKGYDEGFGVRFEKPVFDGIRQCANRCVFCFVDQMPPGLRDSLYIKDDDFRLSFLQGSFITLTNLSGADIRRIEREKLSPLYVSVHATEPSVRSGMLGREGEDRLRGLMAGLGRAGISFHCQIVLCPGYNDGEILEKTVDDLGRMRGVLSVAVVPVGLTAFRRGLPELRRVEAPEAERLIAWTELRQKTYLREKGTRFVWLSDEFYVLAGHAFPDEESYEDYPQWENGVGRVRGLLEEAGQCRLPEELPEGKRLILAGGVAAMKALAPLWERLRSVRGLTLDILPLENRFFGPSVDVSGLLTGKCLTEGLGAYRFAPGTTVYLPGVMRREDDGRLIDGLSAEEVERRLRLKLVFLPQSGKEILEMLFEG